MSVAPPSPAPARARRSRGNVVLLAVIAVALLAVVGVTAGVVFTQRAQATVRVSTVSFDLSDPHLAKLQFQVVRPHDRTVVCAARARTRDNELAGRVTDLVVPPSAGDTTRLDTTVPLQVPAVIVEVESCVLQAAPPAG